MLTVDIDIRTEVPASVQLDETFIERVLRAAADHQKVDGEVSVSVVDDEEIHEINRTWRDVDRPTDVISFAFTEDEEEAALAFEDAAPDVMLGDIIVSLPTAIRQAEAYGHSAAREFGFLLVHGFLHLIGYDHDTPEKESVMFGLQDEILSGIGLERTHEG